MLCGVSLPAGCMQYPAPSWTMCCSGRMITPLQSCLAASTLCRRLAQCVKRLPVPASTPDGPVQRQVASISCGRRCAGVPERLGSMPPVGSGGAIRAPDPCRAPDKCCWQPSGSMGSAGQHQLAGLLESVGGGLAAGEVGEEGGRRCRTKGGARRRCHRVWRPRHPAPARCRRWLTETSARERGAGPQSLRDDVGVPAGLTPAKHLPHRDPKA